jgi:hypothetical protein
MTALYKNRQSHETSAPAVFTENCYALEEGSAKSLSGAFVLSPDASATLWTDEPIELRSIR